MARVLVRWLLAVTLAVALVPLAAGPQGAADAQTQGETVNYAGWEPVAIRAEAALEAGRASSAALGDLRGEIADWRSQFQAATQTNETRLRTVRAQIAALGPVPETGSETEEVAVRRADLTAELERLNRPVVAAQTAFDRANALIGEIDRVIRERQSALLFSLGPSPLNPVLWATAIGDFADTLSALLREVASSWNSDSQRAELRANLADLVLALLIGGALLLRGRHWVRMLQAWLARISGRGGELWWSLLSIGEVILPLIGVFALVEAAFSTGLIGIRGSVLLASVPIWGAYVMIGRWMGGRIFHRNATHAIFNLEPLAKTEARGYVLLLALVLIAREVLVQLAEVDLYSAESLAVLAFPILVAAALILMRAGFVLIKFGRKVSDDEAESNFRARLVTYFGRASVAVAAIAPVLAAIGFNVAADALIYPWIMTLGLSGLILILQDYIRDLHAYFSARGDKDSLITVLANFALVILALPVVSLIWGARTTDLTELWSRFLEGFAIGATRISPTDFLLFVLVFVLGFTATRLMQAALRTTVLPRTRIDRGGQTAIVSGVGYVGIFLAALIAITTAGIDLSGLAIVAGALSVGIGFGLQTIVSNFVSGIILLIERPISEGDWIEVGGNTGIVRDISVRATRIETFDRTDVIVPNADLVSGTVTNWTRGNTVGRVIVPVGVAYGSDTRKVEEVLLDIAKAHPMVLMAPPPSVVFQGFGADSMDFEIRAILRDVNWVLTVRSDMNHEIARKFAEEGIEIPFMQRDIWIRNPEALPGGAPDGKDDAE